MMFFSVGKLVLTLGIAYGSIAVVSAVGAEVPLKVLFIGDSFTYFQTDPTRTLRNWLPRPTRRLW
jgi:hypothetical protein